MSIDSKHASFVALSQGPFTGFIEMSLLSFVGVFRQFFPGQTDATLGPLDVTLGPMKQSTCP